MASWDYKFDRVHKRNRGRGLRVTVLHGDNERAKTFYGPNHFDVACAWIEELRRAGSVKRSINYKRLSDRAATSVTIA